MANRIEVPAERVVDEQTRAKLVEFVDNALLTEHSDTTAAWVVDTIFTMLPTAAIDLRTLPPATTAGRLGQALLIIDTMVATSDEARGLMRLGYSIAAQDALLKLHKTLQRHKPRLASFARHAVAELAEQALLEKASGGKIPGGSGG